jgi:hypothetical protein
MANNNVYGRLSKSVVMSNELLLSDEELRILGAPLIKLVGKP